MSTTISEQAAAAQALQARGRQPGIFHRLRGEGGLGYLLITPTLLYMLALLLYPLILSIWFSVSSASVGDPYGSFIGLKNFSREWDNQVFREALRNSFVFTFGSEIGKAILGTTLAFLLLRDFRGKKVVRGLLMLPWTVPIALTTLGWQWMFDPQFSVINWILTNLGLVRHGPNWLGTQPWAFLAVMTVNIWRGFPFSAIILLAGLTSVPPDIIDSARVDGAGFLRRFHHVIVPMILPILFVGLIFDVVFTFTDLSVVYLLTRGGPLNSTHILPTLAFQNGIQGGDLAGGSAIGLFMLPVLLVACVFLLRLLKHREI